MTRFTRGPASLSLLFLCAAFLVAGCSQPARELQVTYYYLPGCSTCEGAAQNVATLEKDFPGQVRIAKVDAKAPDGVKAVKLLGLQDHGIVIRSHRGAVLWKQAGDNLKIDEVRQELQNQLAFMKASL